uniref:Uncharacterized protein n=1 Tax=Solanum lycopersicum TaxID=4081 RepID=A0A3Q7FKK7_SOLLC
MSQTKNNILAIFVLSMIFSNIVESIEGRNIKFEDKKYLMKPNALESRKLAEFTVQNNEYPLASPSPGHVDGHSPGIGH